MLGGGEVQRGKTSIEGWGRVGSRVVRRQRRRLASIGRNTCVARSGEAGPARDRASRSRGTSRGQLPVSLTPRGRPVRASDDAVADM